MMRQIEGKNPVYEALRAGTFIEKIFIKNEGGISRILTLAKKRNIPVFIENTKKISKTNRDQGVIAIAAELTEPKLKSLLKPDSVFVVLAGPVYEHNLGSVLRSAECAGASAVIVPKEGMPLTSAVTKSSAGASEYIPLIHHNICSALKMMQKHGYKIFGLKEGKNKSIFSADLTPPIAVIIGAEDTGINKSLEKYIDEFLSIPMKGKIESLNMAVAASLCLFEIQRQLNN